MYKYSIELKNSDGVYVMSVGTYYHSVTFTICRGDALLFDTIEETVNFIRTNIDWAFDSVIKITPMKILGWKDYRVVRHFNSVELQMANEELDSHIVV